MQWHVTSRVGSFAAVLFCLSGVSHANAQPAQLCDTELWWGDEKLRACISPGHDIFTANANITRAVIVVHGNSRNGVGYFNSAWNAASVANAQGNTIVIAPQFITADDATNFSLDRSYETWTDAGWKRGLTSTNLAINSSFDWIDLIVKSLVDIQPNLAHIVVAGFSAGGQFVNRYSAASWSEAYAMGRAGVTMTYVVGAASSYLWMDGTRPEEVAGDCPEYNHYPFGFDAIPGDDYFTNWDRDEGRERVAWRSTYYFVGQNDNSSSHAELDISCDARRQGTDRLSRARNYNAHLLTYFNFQYPLLELPNVGHSFAEASNTVELRNMLFVWGPY